MSNQVRIVTDSASDLSDDRLAKARITVVPLAIRFGEKQFIDRVELSNEEFWRRMETANELPGTAAPSPGDFVDAFRKAKEDGANEVVCVTISSKLSATYQAAVQAARDVAAEITVQVIDSMLCTIAQGTLCLEAARLAGAGVNASDIAQQLEEMKGRVRLFGTLDTLDNLRKGGRIGAASAFFGSILSVKPVITIKDGEVQPMSRQRTRRRALEHLAGLVNSVSGATSISVAHSGAPDIDEFKEQLNGAVSAESIPTFQIGPVIGSHGGPRLVAVAFVESHSN